jgi:hypothetical protein
MAQAAQAAPAGEPRRGTDRRQDGTHAGMDLAAVAFDNLLDITREIGRAIYIRGTRLRLLLTGLAPGTWSIQGQVGKIRFNARVEAGQNTAFFVVPGGRFTVQPEAR